MSTTLAESLNTANETQRAKYKTQLLRWMCQFNSELDYAVTLTLQPEKVNYLISKGFATNKADLIVKLKQSMRYFTNRLNRIFYKASANRHCKTSLVIPVIEGISGDKRLHYHLAISTPVRFTLLAISEIIEREWAKTYLGGHEVVVKEYTSTGWLGYITKEATKPTVDNVDWDNVKIPYALLQTLH